VPQYVAGRGTVRFPLDKPLPMKLIDQVIELRVADNLTNTKSKTGYRKY
jgi:uncharacterized protein YdhG (YjbR/CyaY superfamily)